MNDDISVALKVVRVLERLEVPYLIGGSLASSTHGLARATANADIPADLKTDHVDEFVAALEADFYVSKDSALQAISRCSSFNLIDYSTGFKVDIFIPRNRNFDRMQLSNRVQIAVSDDDMAFFASPEDTIIAKLEWYRAGEEVSDRQWNDISGVIKLQGANLNLEYMQDRAKELGISDLLDRVLEQAGD
ncbi:hypothetical protein KF728_16640 [Candidatus Obscuribacterales bacterium]|nr:hypothetical protein [Candidatus Obscuribacterales bacterium]MBX3151786.1 hypothetical protein [Candidatus Obscuribacterales bacterium]